MGREIRKVPPDWEHPRDENGNYHPMFDRDYESKLQEWWDGREKWKTEPESDCTWEEWAGRAPDPEYYRPAWTEDQATHFQMYEDVTEGTPVSPIFAMEAELGEWLRSQGYSEYATGRFLADGWAPSFVMTISPDGVTAVSGLGISAFDAMSDTAIEKENASAD